MSGKRSEFIKSVSYTFTSNFISFAINALILLVVPKLIDSDEYGYFQFYTLMATYAAYFHLGIADGIQLKDAGKNYSDLNRRILSSQLRILVSIAIIFFIFINAVKHFVSFDEDKNYIFLLFSICILFVNVRVFSTVILSVSSRFKEYSRIIIIEKVIYAIFLFVVLICGLRDYKILIIGDVIGKSAAALLGVYYCKDIVISKSESIPEALKESIDNFKIGIMILATNLSGILITGIIQFFVEDHWDISTFGKVSLGFNISKMLMVVINAVSMVLLPTLKNISMDKLPRTYKMIRTPLSTILIVMLLAYYPLSVILKTWLPQYNDSIFFASLIFPMCLFESKTSMLINTYLKVLRKEKWLCIGNIITVALSAVFAGVTVYIFDNIIMTVLVIPMLFVFRCIILERPLSALIKVPVMRSLAQEVFLAGIFIFVNYFFKTSIAFALYFLAVVIYILINMKDIKAWIENLK